MIYDLNYFIAKFEAIPEWKWITLRYHDERGSCALGHCGCRENQDATTESLALETIFKDHLDTHVYKVNDGGYFALYQQPTPKQRILAALYDIKANRAVAEAESIINAEPQTQVA